MTTPTRTYDATSIDTRRTNPAWALVDVSGYPGAIYASIRVHKVNHQRRVSLAILHPGKDYIESETCVDTADAEAYATELGAQLLTGFELAEKVDERREVKQPAPEIPDAVLSAAARLHVTDVYAVGKDTWQVERFGRASTLRRELEALGFVVRSATDDRLDDQRYCYAMFREGANDEQAT